MNFSLLEVHLDTTPKLCTIKKFVHYIMSTTREKIKNNKLRSK